MWLIVSDGSRDKTDEFVSEYSKKYKFIKLLRLENNIERSFCAKASALNNGYKRLKNMDFEFVGFLDADVTFNEIFYENVFIKFQQNIKLGISGGFIYENFNGNFRSRPFNTSRSVPGSNQMFRRECFDAIKGFPLLKYGAEDLYADIMARNRGFEVISYPDLKVYHHRKTGYKYNKWSDLFNLGLRDYSIGYHPVYEFFMCLRRLRCKPCVIGVLLRMSGFIWACLIWKKRIVSNELVKYHRKEQMERLNLLIQKFSKK